MLPHMQSGKTPAPTLEELFPSFYKWATLGAVEEVDKDAILAKQAMKAMMMMGKAPEHLQDKILDKEEK